MQQESSLNDVERSVSEVQADAKVCSNLINPNFLIFVINFNIIDLQIKTKGGN